MQLEHVTRQRTFESLAPPPAAEQRQFSFSRDEQRAIVDTAFRKEGVCGLTTAQRGRLFLLFNGLIGCPEPATQEKLRDRIYADAVSTVSKIGTLAESLGLLTRVPAVGGLHHRANWDALAQLAHRSGLFLSKSVSINETRFDYRSAQSGSSRAGARPPEKIVDSAQGQSATAVPPDPSRPRDGDRPPADRDLARDVRTLTLEREFTSPPNPQTLGNSLPAHGALAPTQRRADQAAAEAERHGGGPQPIGSLLVPALDAAARNLGDPKRREAELLGELRHALVVDEHDTSDWDGVQPKTRANIVRAALMGQNSDGARGIPPADWQSVLATCRRGWKLGADGERELLRSRRAYMLKSFDEACRRNGQRLHRHNPQEAR